jgi:hypothetical protein
MDALMLGVTGVALALAVGMSIIAVRLLRGERHRSAARVSALESAAFDDLEYREPEVEDEPEDDLRAPDPWRGHQMEIDLPVGAMFTATNEPKAPGRRWLALAAVAIVMAGLVGTIYVVFKPATVDASSTEESSSASASAPAAAPSSSGTVSQAVQLRPIELLSLKHTIEGDTFSLVGLVVNPIDARPLAHVVAVVYLFDKAGAYFASGKAELEFSGLRPGEESPFAIKISNVAHVGKYRVGFRREDGSVIAHVDKRGQRAGSMTEGGGE